MSNQASPILDRLRALLRNGRNPARNRRPRVIPVDEAQPVKAIRDIRSARLARDNQNRRQIMSLDRLDHVPMYAGVVQIEHRPTHRSDEIVDTMDRELGFAQPLNCRVRTAVVELQRQVAQRSIEVVVLDVVLPMDATHAGISPALSFARSADVSVVLFAVQSSSNFCRPAAIWESCSSWMMSSRARVSAAYTGSQQK